MLSATVIAGLRFRKMMHSALAICFISFFIDPRPVTLHTVFQKKLLQHSELVSERCSCLSTCAVVDAV